ncbi:MAG: hypothetical protein AB9917_06465 [Negativicutes bacterium]
MLIKFSPIGETSTLDTLLGEVYLEWSTYYRTLGRFPVMAADMGRREVLLNDLESEYSNKI